MNQILALLEQDPSYCERFLKYASSRTECPFTVYTFQTVTELQRFAHQNDIDLLLSDAQAAGDEELEKLPVHTRVELTEEPMGETQVLAGGRPDAPHKIYKYQSGEKILHELVSSYQLAKKSEPKNRQGLARLYLVYSPIGRSGKTCFAESLTKTLEKDMRALYVSLEEVSARADASMQSGSGSLSDALYFSKKERLDAERLRTMITRVDGMDLIPPVRSPEDIATLRDAELPQFIQTLRAEVDYDAIVLDTDSILSRVEGILPQADWIFMPVTDQPAHYRKLSALEHYLSGSPHRAALDRIVKLIVPLEHTGYSEAEVSERLSEFTAAVIRNYLYDAEPQRAVRQHA